METDTSISSGSAAPPTDTAAAPSGGSAADSSAAAPPAPESAASQETGAQGQQGDTLDALYERFSEQSRQPAQPENPEQSAEQVEEAKPEEAEPVVEEEAEAAPDADPLAEFEQGIPTREDINSRFKRAPQAIRDEFAVVAERLTARESERAELGGDEGVAVAKAILPHLLSGDTSAEAVDGFMEAFTTTNLPLARQIGQNLVGLALDDEQTGKAFGDSLLAGQFGEGYDSELVGKLVEAHRSGLVNLDEIQEDLGFARTPTERERELQTKLEAAEKQVRDYEGNRDETARREEQKLSDAVDDFVSREAMAEVLPIVTKLGWVPREGEEATDALKLHGSMVTAWLDSELKSSPEYTRVQALKEAGNAFRDGKPTTQMRAAMTGVRTRAKALALRAGRTLAPTYAKSFSRANAQPPTGKSGAAPAAPAPPPQQTPPAPAPQQALSTDELLAQAAARHAAAARDAEATVGRR